MRQAVRRKYHYIYKITRTDGSGKYYIGMHSTDDLEDGYFGSGSLLSKSIKKHGKEKHVREILEYLPSREALKLREKEIVNEEILSDKKCMNLQLGGEGGGGIWSPEHLASFRIGAAKSASKAGKIAADLTFAERQRRSVKRIETQRKNGTLGQGFRGRIHSEESKLKIKEGMKVKRVPHEAIKAEVSSSLCRAGSLEA